MGLASRNHDHLARADLDLPLGTAEDRLPLQHDEDLGVVVPVQGGATAGRRLHEEEGHTNPVMVPSLEPERVVAVRELIVLDHLHGCQYAAVLAEAVDLLRCPVCGGGLDEGPGALRCEAGHSFDIARQGYVNLVPGPGDTVAMVEAREGFLGAGHYRRLGEALVEDAAGVSAPGAVVDVGAGTGHHLAPVLDALPGRTGLALDASSAALRRAARAHPRAAAVGADVWRELPLRDAVAALVLSVFAPRNAAEMARVLAPGGVLLAVTPTTRHLHELVGPLGLLSVPEDKADRLDAQLASHFELSARRTVEHSMFLAREEAAQLVRMGPSAWHVDEQAVDERLAVLPDPLTVTASVSMSRYVRA